MKPDCKGKYKHGKKLIDCTRTKGCKRYSVYPKSRKRIYLSDSAQCDKYDDIYKHIT